MKSPSPNQNSTSFDAATGPRAEAEGNRAKSNAVLLTPRATSVCESTTLISGQALVPKRRTVLSTATGCRLEHASLDTNGDTPANRYPEDEDAKSNRAHRKRPRKTTLAGDVTPNPFKENI